MPIQVGLALQLTFLAASQINLDFLHNSKACNVRFSKKGVKTMWEYLIIGAIIGLIFGIINRINAVCSC